MTANLMVAPLALACLLPLAAPISANAEPHIAGVWRMTKAPKNGAEMTPPISAPPLRPEVAGPYQEQQVKAAQALAEGRPLAPDQELCVPLGMALAENTRSYSRYSANPDPGKILPGAPNFPPMHCLC